MTRWITPWLATGAFDVDEVPDGVQLIDVRELVDRGGNSPESLIGISTLRLAHVNEDLGSSFAAITVYRATMRLLPPYRVRTSTFPSPTLSTGFSPRQITRRSGSTCWKAFEAPLGKSAEPLPNPSANAGF